MTRDAKENDGQASEQSARGPVTFAGWSGLDAMPGLVEALCAESNDAILVTDAHQRILYANPRFQELCGHSLATMAGKRPGDLLQGPATDTGKLAGLSAAARAGRTGAWEVVNYAADGTPYIVRIKLVPLSQASDGASSSEGAPAFLAIERDVTAERRTAALDSARATAMRRLAEGADLATILANFAGELEAGMTDGTVAVALVNPDGESLSVVAAPSFPEICGPAAGTIRVAADARCCGRAVYDGRPVVTPDITKDPSWAPHREAVMARGFRGCWSQPIRGNDGTILATLGQFVRTPRAPDRAERTFMEQCCEIAATVIERKGLEDRLKAAQAQAERDNQAKNKFLANISHELRTPLTAISGYSEVMARAMFGPLAAPYSEYAQNVFASAKHLQGLVDEIIDLARIERGQIELALTRLDIAETLTETSRMLAPADQARVQIRSEADLWVRGDHRRLCQCVLNLLTNALKYTDDPAITLAAERHGSHVTIRVADRGPGIPQDDLPRVTEAFYRGRRSPELATVPGTGAGLATVQALVRAMGGELSITSEEGAGTEAIITLATTNAPTATGAGAASEMPTNSS